MTPTPSGKLTPVQAARAAELRGRGWSCDRIARQLGVSVNTVALHFHHHGDPLARRAKGGAS